MKTNVRRLARDEKGAALVLAIILLLIGGLVTAPLLAHMGTGILTGEVYETRTAELYAADAGIEDAVWKIQHRVPEVEGLTHCNQSTNYTMTAVNGKNVDVSITLMTIVDDLPFDYRVVSTATGDGSGTQVEAYVPATIRYCSILDYLVTIHENLDDKAVAALEEDLDNLNIPCPENCAECDKCGRAYDYFSEAYESIPEACKGCIAVYNFPDVGWPTASDLSARYLNDVQGAEKWISTMVDLEGSDLALPELYVDGELTVENGDQTSATLTLDGTLYITGHTEIGLDGTGGKPNLIIELNNQAIFIACDYTKKNGYALEIGPWCTINGPGVIIAVGDIYFQPNGAVGLNEEPALVLSVSGITTIQPGVDFLGTVAGQVDVNLGAGNADVSHPLGGFGPVNFPSPFELRRTYGIVSWEISQLLQ